MKAFIPCVLLFFFIAGFVLDGSFKSKQLQIAKVKKAFAEKEPNLQKEFSSKKINFASSTLFLRAFKQEEVMELWARNGNEGAFRLIKTYPLCQMSGVPGPKRQQGDHQIPEGYYHIEIFNPYSSYYLSLGINYPNASDKILGTKGRLGGDIYLHGECVTIGCLTFTNEEIKELYVACTQARSNGQTSIPVHIYPCRMNNSNMAILKNSFKKHSGLIKFWNNLKTGYDLFEMNNKLFSFSVDSSGYYKY